MEIPLCSDDFDDVYFLFHDASGSLKFSRPSTLLAAELAGEKIDEALVKCAGLKSEALPLFIRLFFVLVSFLLMELKEIRSHVVLQLVVVPEVDK